MKNTILVITAILLTTPLVVCADPPAGRGQGNSSANVYNKQVLKNTPSVVVTVPPGTKNGNTPYGLSKQNKTPPGWNKGEKQGWSRSLWDDLFGK
jgi:hypothetical protein